MNIEIIEYSPGQEDPKQIVLDKLGSSLDEIPDIYGARVLIATAPAPKTVGRSGLIIATDKQKDESRWQCKAGLVIKLGPDAFRYDPRNPGYPWEGPKPQIGDWVFFKSSDTSEIGIGGISCRTVWDDSIIGVVTTPLAVY